MKQLIEDPIAILILILGFGYLFAITFYPPLKPDGSGITIGVLSMMGIVINYKYGSSKGSAKKDDALINNSNKPL